MDVLYIELKEVWSGFDAQDCDSRCTLLQI